MTRRWRQLTVWLHVLTSVGWMAQAMSLCVLLSIGSGAATAMAQALDGRLVGPMADASVFTGVMLGAATAWGIFRNWWVFTKFAISMVQFVLAIFVLSPALDAATTSGPGPAQIVGSGLMASAIAFQGWLSIAKPWGRIGPRRPLPGTAPAWVFAATVLGGLADLALALVIGHPMPLLSLILLIAGLSRRPHWTRGPGRLQVSRAES
ncbi:hypothetical protein ACIA5C_41685 [Actinoplanes sp. NPDC051343]|uniref:hypothetical protein n=1 Tax=Actinoplanes sp. NPDC051343 TaxID=3363906 RepID=UPI003787AA0B